MSAQIFTNFAQILTCESSHADTVHTDTALAVVDGSIAALASEMEVRRRFPDAALVDGQRGVLTPGFVDSHTHALFGKWRADEYAMRAHGMSYMEIASLGGGINASVTDLRGRGEDELVEMALPRIRELTLGGSTTVEIKSGYGLRTEDELKMLRAIDRLAHEVPIDIVPTLLAAHEFPAEYKSSRDAYVDLIVHDTIPAVAAERLAVFCDVFMEPGVFTRDQTRLILETGIEHGLVPKLHADEFEWSGGAELAAELGAASADHLGAISEAGIAALAASNTMATLLPATLFFLGKCNFAPARRLLDAGAALALATDYNPGTAASPSMQLALTCACSYMKLDPLEAMVAATAGGARALRREDGLGTLRIGAPADLVVWGVGDYREIPYRLGSRLVQGVWKKGRKIA
jgi:imidazolonepropionase